MADRDGSGTAKPNVFTIPAGENFLSRLARAVIDGALPRMDGRAVDTLSLSRFTILLPTRRACRAMQDAFLAEAGRSATVLPQIRPISDVDEDAQLLGGLADDNPIGGGAPLDLPAAVSELERRLILTQFILKWLRDTPAASGGEETRLPMSPAQAVGLARELTGLMDEIENGQADVSRLAEDLPGEFAAHWEKTSSFLQVATETFPAYLQANGLVSPSRRRNILWETEAGRLLKERPEAPLIVAGVTGSLPATATLMRAVAQLENGAIVLPGLDRDLDADAWARLGDAHPEHPQSGLAQLLSELQITRDDVEVLAPDRATESAGHRNRLISQALRPAATTAVWRDYVGETTSQEIDAAVHGLTYLEAQSAQEEGEAIALILRGVVEQPGKTAALVTPDRILARRVVIRLEAWGVRIDDSAGRPLMKTVPGTFLDLILECFETNFCPTSVVALLKHPLTRLGMEPARMRQAAVALELLAFRQIYLGQGLPAVRASLVRRMSPIKDNEILHRAIQSLDDEQRSLALHLLDALEAAVAPFVGLARDETLSLRDFVRLHVQIAETIAGDETGDGRNLWGGEAGEVAAHFFSGILDDDSPHPDLSRVDYPSFFRSLVAGEVVRPRLSVHPRLSIWGPFEARLQQADVMILGGLNDGKWPNLAEPDPWINRPMRQQIGLPPPEERIGFAAHDFSQLAASPRVYLTRAAKVDGVPTVPSRWILRLEAVLKAFGKEDAIRPQREEAWLGWAVARDETSEHRPVRAPRPAPPVGLRPRRMSVTRIESWLANPYAVFARSILRLDPLDPLESLPDAATRGRIIHQALHRFTVRYPGELPGDSADRLMSIADEILDEYAAHPRVAAFWRPRFRRFAQWFGETEPARREGISKIVTEVSGQRTIKAPGGPFIVTARADRLDLADDGTVLIYDYKSGTAPSEAKVISGVSPQLPLEAAIVLSGGFEDLAKTSVSALSYISATGGEPPGEVRRIEKKAPDDLAREALAQLTLLVADFDRPETDYRAIRRVAFANAYRYDDYAHLARVQEWSLGGDDA